MNTHSLVDAQARSHLFTVRLWVAEVSVGEHEVRMQVKHVRSGETRYFRTWPELTNYLEQKLQGRKQSEQGKGEEPLSFTPTD